jgi:hypothetical protein
VQDCFEFYTVTSLSFAWPAMLGTDAKLFQGLTAARIPKIPRHAKLIKAQMSIMSIGVPGARLQNRLFSSQIGSFSLCDLTTSNSHRLHQIGPSLHCK